MYRFALLLLCSMHAIASDNRTLYYKCESPQGVIFSQYPCSSNAVQHKITHSNASRAKSAVNYSKQLNRMEKEQKHRQVTLEINLLEHQIAKLKRERESQKRAEQDRLSHVMSDDERRKLAKQVKGNIKRIDKDYSRRIKETRQEISRRKKSLSAYK